MSEIEIAGQSSMPVAETIGLRCKQSDRIKTFGGYIKEICFKDKSQKG